MLGHASRVSSPYQNKKKFSLTCVQNWVVFFLVCWKITLKNKYGHCVISHIQLTQCTCSTFSHFCNCWAHMGFQVTVHNQCPKCPPPETMHASTRKITDCRTTFYSSRGGCEWFDRHKNYFFEMFVYFQLELNALWFLSISIDKI